MTLDNGTHEPTGPRWRESHKRIAAFVIGAVLGAPTGVLVAFLILAVAGLLFWPHDVGGGFILMILLPVYAVVGAIVCGLLAALLSGSARRVALCADLGLLAGALVGFAADVLGPMSMNIHLWAVAVLSASGAVIGAVIGVQWARRTRRDDAHADDAA